MGIEYGFDIPKLLFTGNNRKRKIPTSEYGSGDSVTKFLKLFRDKYVHHPEMNADGVFELSENDGIFCEEIYVRKLTSTCPSISAALYRVLSQHAQLESLLPLRKLYFPRTFIGTRTVRETNFGSTHILAIPDKAMYGREALLSQFKNFFRMQEHLQESHPKRTCDHIVTVDLSSDDSEDEDCI